MSEVTSPVILDTTGQLIASAISNLGAQALNRIQALDNTPIAGGNVLHVVGIPTYVSDISAYASYNLTDTGWYAFLRINAKSGTTVTQNTAVTGAAGVIATVGNDYVDIAVKFDVAAVSVRVSVDWGDYADVFVVEANDLAIRNLDYRTTFYVYDVSPYVTWEYKLTTDTSFVAATTKSYYVKDADGAYTKAEITVGNAIPAYYTKDGNTYTQAEGTFAEGVTYYTKSGTTYTEAEVTVGETIPAYYVHSKIIFEGLARNITYRLDEPIDCPMEFILPDIEDETHGAWFEIRCRHLGGYSMTLTPPSSDVKIATEHTQKETAGMNNIDLHYMYVDGVKLWRFLNTHSSIPA